MGKLPSDASSIARQKLRRLIGSAGMTRSSLLGAGDSLAEVSRGISFSQVSLIGLATRRIPRRSGPVRVVQKAAAQHIVGRSCTEYLNAKARPHLLEGPSAPFPRKYPHRRLQRR